MQSGLNSRYASGLVCRNLHIFRGLTRQRAKQTTSFVREDGGEFPAVFFVCKLFQFAGLPGRVYLFQSRPNVVE